MDFSKRKKKLVGRAALAFAGVLLISSSFGMLSGCSSDEDATKTTSTTDTQLLKNGNFEYYDDYDGLYFISSPSNWSKSSLGTSSYTTSGVISTLNYKWDVLTSTTFARRLYLNNLLSSYYSSDEDDFEDDYEDYYMNFNSLSEYDLLYKDVGSAIDVYADAFADVDIDDPPKFSKLLDLDDVYYNELESSFATLALSKNEERYFKNADLQIITDAEESGDISFIDNPGTHEGNYSISDTKNSDGSYTLYLDGEEAQKVYLNDGDGDEDLGDGALYSSYNSTTNVYSNPLNKGSVLMVHNYLKNGNGTGTSYTASTSISLEPNTAAEISVWVKTSDLTYNGGQEITQDRGAFIQVDQTVGSTSLDSFYIKNIRTDDVEENNGWKQYTIYVQACDYTDTTLSITLGLGGDGAEAVEGYAFFDDVQVTKYSTLNSAISDDSELSVLETIQSFGTIWDGEKYLTKENGGAYCSLLSEADDKIFEADCYYYNNGSETKDIARYSNIDTYYIDLTSQNDKQNVELTADNLTMGLTVDDDYYTVNGTAPTVIGSATQDTNTQNGEATNSIDASEKDGYYYLNSVLSSIDTTNDILANLTLDNLASESSLTTALSGSAYSTLLYEQLSSVTSLPNSENNTNVVLMLSTMGAGYTATIDNNFSIDEDCYLVISVWVKTSDMCGGSALTFTLIDSNDDSNIATLAIDTTDVTTDISKNDGTKDEDIYDGWVQCFFYIYNDTEETQYFTIEVSFGNTTIKDTSISSYLGGWGAFTNLQTLEVSEDEYNLVTSTTYGTSLSFTESDNRSSNYFDTATSDTQIETNITNASNYTGVNGASTSIIATDTITSYDYTNTNDNSGLINVDYFSAYLAGLLGIDEDDLSSKTIADLLSATNTDYAWLRAILAANYEASDSSYIDATTMWNSIFGKTSVQPLIIVDTLRTYASVASITEDTVEAGNYYYYDEDTDTYIKATKDNFDEDETYYTLEQAINYGYIGATSTISSDSYVAITVKVKVSGTTAYVYLTDSTSDRAVINLKDSIPEYTFWYDEDGNVLKEEPDEDADDYDEMLIIAYALRSDGLYDLYNEGVAVDDGYQYANLSSLTPYYYNEHISYYDAEGNEVSFDDLEDDVYYYADAECTTYAAHSLVNSDGTKVYYYSGVGTGNDAVYNYYYYDEDYDLYRIDTSYQIKMFDTTYATPRYTSSNYDNIYYYYEIGDTNGEWVTVSFYIHTGSEAKSYRLELWSGERDSSGVSVELGDSVKASDVIQDGYVIFDYSYVSLDEDTYTSLLSEYTDVLIKKYQVALLNAGVTIDSYDENLAYYERLANDNGIEKLDEEYTALYYMFTLYDSAAFYPFNEDTADDTETGYDYSITDYEETLVYFKSGYSMFIDYSAIDQSVSIDTVSTDTDDDDESTDSDTNFWLLFSSIVLVVALLLTLIAMIIRQIVKKLKIKSSIKKMSQNQFTKRKRYLRSYTKANGEVTTNNETEATNEDSNKTE